MELSDSNLLLSRRGFEYTSSVISTPVGTIQGKYKMVAEDGTPFDKFPVTIFRFRGLYTNF